MKSIYAAAMLGLGVVTLAGCSDDAAETEQAASPLTATEAKLYLPAVEGNPGVVYFTLANTADRPIAVRRADVEGAGSAELHDYMEYDDTEMGAIGMVTVEPGESVSFEPGDKHVMAFDLDPSVAAGSKAKVTLTMAGGSTMEFEADVLPADAER